ncbi:MAG: hypothetical protein PUH21_02320 [Prevotellaceae bacterium]|jgi:ATP-dependent protease HslVU (ClpYQ) ATPase subunit|nr:hypothetical protein [Prevotellaceae bacterium]MDY3856707.1 hypothetical protein [Bacteroidaceae bacterium]
MAERKDLLDELKVKLNILIRQYHNLEKYEEAARILKEENEQLKKQYEELRTATTLKLSKDDIRQTKLYVSRLIREIDKCIALLSA